MKKCSSCEIEKDTEAFYASSSQCKECRKTTAKAWYAANTESAKKRIAAYQLARPEKRAEWTRRHYYKDVEKTRQRRNEWAHANPEKRRIARANWNNGNRGRIAVVSSAWLKKNRDKANAYYAKYRAAKLRAIPKWANQFFISEAYHLAKLRTKLLGYPWHVDHIVPLISKLVCGLHVENNLQVIPGSENAKKSNRHWPDMP